MITDDFSALRQVSYKHYEDMLLINTVDVLSEIYSCRISKVIVGTITRVILVWHYIKKRRTRCAIRQ